jgi:hypothetical protein
VRAVSTESSVSRWSSRPRTVRSLRTLSLSTRVRSCPSDTSMHFNESRRPISRTRSSLERAPTGRPGSRGARAEWLGEFRSNLERFVWVVVVDSCSVPDRHEFAPVGGASYVAVHASEGGFPATAPVVGYCPNYR